MDFVDQVELTSHVCACHSLYLLNTAEFWLWEKLVKWFISVWKQIQKTHFVKFANNFIKKPQAFQLSTVIALTPIILEIGNRRKHNADVFVVAGVQFLHAISYSMSSESSNVHLCCDHAKGTCEQPLEAVCCQLEGGLCPASAEHPSPRFWRPHCRRLQPSVHITSERK